MNQLPFIPFHRPSIGEDEINEVVQTLRSGWLTTGPQTARFETEFREYVGAQHVLAVNSCSAGLHLALASLYLGPGDEVITTPLTFCATVNAIIHVGATPVLADVAHDGNLDPESVAQHITPRTRAIIPVHLAGLPCRMDEFWSLARKHRLYVVEDAAHALGSRFKGAQIGSGSDAVAFSFYATKNLTTGEGGMVTSGRDSLIDRMRLLCLHGINRDAWNRYAEKGNWFYRIMECGFKYNLSDIQSAIGIHQLRKQEQFIQQRERYANLYNRLLSEIDEVELPPNRSDCRHCWHLYMIRLNLTALSINRAEFINELRLRQIGCSVHFIPIPLHPYYESKLGLSAQQCPNAMNLYPRLISLPLYPAMDEEQVLYIAESIREIVRANRVQKTVAMQCDSMSAIEG
jgi:dTDP-4-amino-4,6-dideoxygalactose transaminase